MVVYVVKITIPKNTPKTSPKEVTVELEKAVITRLFIQIPPGHHALTGLRIMYGNLQLWPKEFDTWFTGDDIVLNFDEYFELPDDPTKLRIEGYNEDDTYDHSFIIHIATLPRYIAGWMIALTRFVRLFRRLIGLR